MKIEHIALYVRDLEREKKFFEKYFEGRAGAKYHNSRTGLTSYFISFKDGARLEIMNVPDLQKVNSPLKMTGYAHLAFSTGSKENVDALPSA